MDQPSGESLGEQDNPDDDDEDEVFVLEDVWPAAGWRQSLSGVWPPVVK